MSEDVSLSRPRYLSYPQVAELLGIRVAALRLLVCRKRIPHVRLGPRTVRFEAAAIEAWLAGCAVEAASTSTSTSAATKPSSASAPSQG